MKKDLGEDFQEKIKQVDLKQKEIEEKVEENQKKFDEKIEEVGENVNTLEF